MKALLEIKGWQKVQEVDDSADLRGWVRISIDPPFDILFRPNEKVTNTNITMVDLIYAGIANHMPFFKA